MEKHLEECAACRRELDQLRGDAALLLMSVTDAQPPARARQRLMSAIAAVTRRIHLFASVAVLTMPPALVARMASTIDSVAPGRFGMARNLHSMGEF